MTTASEPPTAREIRDDILAALHADLIGPYAGKRPSVWATTMRCSPRSPVRWRER